MKQEYDLAIVCALALERKFLQRLLCSRKFHSDFPFPFISGASKTSGKFPVCLVQCGLGPTNAAKNLMELLDRVQVKHLLITGLCGSLSSHFRVGDLIVPDRLISADPSSPPIRLPSFRGEHAETASGILISSSEPVITPASRERWHKQTGAVCADMESYTLAEIAQQHGLGLSVIRAVSDDRQTEPDPRVLNLLQENGEPDYRKILMGCFDSPGLLLTLFALFSRARTAMKNIVQELERNGFASHQS